MSEKIERFDIPSKPTRLEMFRAFRQYLEKTTGKKLSPGWYADGPEDRPDLYDPAPTAQTETTGVSADPCIIRLLAEGGAIEAFGSKAPDGVWSFIGTATTLDDDLEPVHAGGVPRTTDLADVLPPQWVVFTPTLIHPDLREWFRSRYDEAVAALPEWRRESHLEQRDHKWRALFESTPPDKWSTEDEF